MLLLYLSTFSLFFQRTTPKQFYDTNPCSSRILAPLSGYTCDAHLTSCHTFIVYRSQKGFNTISKISALFNIDQHDILTLNNLTDHSQFLDQDQEVLIPILCFCSGAFFQANTTYTAPPGTTHTSISCEIFHGLAIIQQNPLAGNLTVPLQCACPDVNDTRNGFKYLVTYPVVEFDTTKLVAERFGISLTDLWSQNSLDPNFPTIYSNTTILVPLRNIPVINSSIRDSHKEDSLFIPLSPTPIIQTNVRKRRLYVIVLGVVFFVIVLVLFSICFYYKITNKHEHEDNKLETVSTLSSTISSLSPDLIAVFSKYNLIRYSVEELSVATKDFSEETRLGSSVHKGNLGGIELVIKNMGFGDARRTVSIHSKINHMNIVKLEGVCYGDCEFSPSYLVFEYATNGSLRDYLLNPRLEVLPWPRRARIALDVAIGLHYIHHCTVPSYIHMNINSKNILITEDWRAKIANFGAGSVDNSSERVNMVVTSEGWIAPEYLLYGLISTKVDVFAFGVVLLELISGIEAKDGKFVTNRLEFLRGGSNGCFNGLRELMDQRMKDYPIAEALCMTVLARACVEDDPLHRPSMDDILKILARMD